MKQASPGLVMDFFRRPWVAGLFVFAILFCSVSFVTLIRQQDPGTVDVSHLIVVALFLSFFAGGFTYFLLLEPAMLRKLLDEKVKELASAEGKYETLFEKSAAAIITFNLAYRIIDVNEAAIGILGYDLEEFRRLSFFDLFRLNNAAEQPVQMDQVVRGEQVLCKRNLIRKDGSTAAIEATIKRVSSSRIMAVLRETGERILPQEQIAASEAIIASIENSPTGIAISDAEGRLIQTNPALCEMFGYTEPELFNLSFQEISHPDDLGKDLEFFENARTGKSTVYNTEKRFFRKDGSVFWVNLHSSVVRDEEGSPRHFYTQVEDITEKVAIRERLMDRENQLSIFVECNPASVAMFDENMCYLMASRKWTSMYHLEGVDFIGKSHYEVFPNLPDRWKAAHERALSGSIEFSRDDSFKTEEGATKWVNWELQPWFRQSGEIGGTILLVEDVAERHEADNNYRLLVEQSMAGVYIYQDGRVVYANPRMGEIYGYTQQEILDLPDPGIALVHHDDRAFVDEQIRLKEQGILSTLHYEVRGLRKSGEVIWTEIFGAETFYKGRRAVIGTLQDVTERKQLESKKEERRSELYAFFENIEGAACLLDAQKRYVIFNRQFQDNYAAVAGFNPRAGMLAYNHFPGQVQDERLKLLDLVLQGNKESVDVEYFVDGKKVVFRTSFSPVINNGKVTGISCYSMDLTKIKEAEQNLQERVKELQCMYRVSELSNNDNNSVDVIMEELVKIVPSAWQYPQITCVSISYSDKVYYSEDFLQSNWLLETPIICNDREVGKIRVYTSQELQTSGTPFLKEERSLVNSIAEMIGSAIEKRMSREEIVKLSRLYQFTSAINEVMLRAADEESILREACEIAVEHGNYRMAWIGTIDTDAEKFSPLATAGHVDGYLDIVHASLSDKPTGRGPSASAMRTNRYHYCNDIANDPAMLPWRKEALERGYRASIALPIVVDGELLAVFSLYRSSAFSINDTEIKLLCEVTENIAYAIQNLRLKEAKQQYLEKLGESEEQFRKLSNETPVGVYIVQDDKFCYVNQRFVEITGYSREVLLDNFFFDSLIHEDDKQRLLHAYYTRVSTQHTATGQFSFKGLRADGTVRHIQVVTSLIGYQGRPAIIGTLIDVSEKVEEDKRFNLAIIEAQESERMVIGMELHDNVKQMMATSLLSLSIIEESLDDKETATAYIHATQEQIREAVGELRRISHQLAPSVDSSLPFEEKIKTLVAGMNLSNDVEVSYEFDSADKQMNSILQLAFYRIIQEQFSNILKYSKATYVQVSLKPNGDFLSLIILDNGVGFDQELQQGGIGLENIKRRAKALNGWMEVVSEPGNGCSLIVNVPVS